MCATKEMMQPCRIHLHDHLFDCAGGRDCSIKLWDIRALKTPMKTCNGQGDQGRAAAITSMAW